MTQDQKREWYYKMIVLAISVGGSILGSYTAVTAKLAGLESRISVSDTATNTRIGLLERRIDLLDNQKLDIKAHDELVAWLKTISAENEASHREIREGIANIQRRRS